jgi:hypothetical protein
MIPRRRNHDDGEDASLSGGSSDGGSGGRTIAAPKSSSSSSGGSNIRNKRTIAMMVLLTAVCLWISKQERLALDESRYEDGRKQFYEKTDRSERYSTLDHYHRSDTQPSGKFVLKAGAEFKPAIAWLMTFPNSGTSYTMSMVSRSTNLSFATNYGKEVIADDEEDSLSIYPRRPEGPYWPGMSGKINKPRDLPTTYVITKTHCGSRCLKCGPEEYVETTEEFLIQCASGHGEYTPGAKRRTYDVMYPPERVERAIHLIRNPIHNLIARYNLEHRHETRKANNTKWLEKHTADADGLHEWCKDFDRDYKLEDIAFYGSEDKVPDAPCHGEFYKWTQWHNLAHESIQLMREGGPAGGARKQFPVLKIFYEDFDNKFEETATSIISFLEQKQISGFRKFESRKDYGSYFPTKELVAIKKHIRNVASNATWADVEHYFADVPDVERPQEEV